MVLVPVFRYESQEDITVDEILRYMEEEEVNFYYKLYIFIRVYSVVMFYVLI